MNKRISLFAGATALFAMGPAGAAVCPADPVNAGTNEATGHVFEVYSAPGITWPAAKACAESKIVGGVAGHLATITSSAEDAYVNELKLALPGEVWVGGSQQVGTGTAYSGWRWENNEGPISVPGLTSLPDSYSNWLPGEPNDIGGTDSENYLGIGLQDPVSGWNDEGNLGNIKGFIVEYDVPRTAACTPGSSVPSQTCETIAGQTLIFPNSSFTAGDTIKFTAYEFTDPRVVNGQCTTRQTLTLFTDPVAFGNDAQLRIPPYLCGSPKFVVVKVDATDLTIEGGAVEVVNDTEVVLPDNLYKCSDPILNNPTANPDPQYQDVVVWQSTDPRLMLENEFGAGIYQGAATEATNGCGSTTAKVRTGSYFVVGMHIDFGGEFDYQQFVDLTLYKLSLLQASVSRAKSAGVLKNGDATKMTAQLDNAVKKLGRGDPSGAFGHVNQFLRFVAAARYNRELVPVGKPYNYNGDHLMRGENIAFMLRVKIVPYKPAP
jgi:hypothetical protein